MKCEITLKILKVSGAGEASVDCFQRLTKCYFIQSYFCLYRNCENSLI